MTVPFPSQQQLDRGTMMRAERRAAVRAARKARLITTKHRALCDACGHEVPAGSSAYWSQGAGVVHDNPDCLAGVGIEDIPPLPDREPGHYRLERDEYALGAITDADDKREAGL